MQVKNQESLNKKTNNLQDFYKLKRLYKAQLTRSFPDMTPRWKRWKRKFMGLISIFCLMISLTQCGKPIPTLTYKLIPQQWKNPRQSEPKDYKGFYHCSNIAVCLSEKDFQFEVIQKKRMEEALKELVKMIEDDNNQYLEYLGTPCGTFDFKCKKDRRGTNLFKE